MEGGKKMLDNDGGFCNLKTIEVIKLNRKRKKYEIAKRGLDVLGGLAGLPIFLIAYILLYIPYQIGANKGQILFKQKRIGKNGKIFEIYKFRSMKENADQILKDDCTLYQKYVQNDYKLEVHEDPRITKLGCFIRKFSIDELPQFLNILKGDMSLVGPRPIVEEELKEYGERACLFLKMKPGLTGIWQTSGRSQIGYPERVNIELSYLTLNSIKMDLKILIKTIIKVFTREGAY